MLGHPALTDGSAAIQRYRVIGFLGQEGSVEVYHAKDAATGQDVALKRLNFGDSGIEWFAQFMLEARTWCKLDSPYVVKTIAVEHELPALYIVTEYPAGQSLREILDRQQNLEVQDAVEIARQCLCGLEAAHGLLVVHRDLKPENVYITQVDQTIEVKIANFGIAGFRGGEREKSAAVYFRGTPGYTPPEQLFLWPDTDVQSDIYAFGVLLFEMLTGCMPYGDNWRDAPINALKEKIAPHPKEPAGLWKIVLRAIHPLPSQRYRSAREMRAAIEELSHSKRRLALSKRSSRVAIGATLGLMVGLAMAWTTTSVGSGRHFSTLARRTQSNSAESHQAATNSTSALRPIPAVVATTTSTTEADRTRVAVNIASTPTATPKAVAPQLQPPTITIDVSVQLSEIDGLKIFVGRNCAAPGHLGPGASNPSGHSPSGSICAGTENVERCCAD